jgi:hypothetical protein
MFNTSEGFQMLTEIKERRAPIDTAAAATYTGVHLNYLEKLRCNGGGPTFIKRNGLVRYDPNDLDAWLEAGKRQSTSEESDAEYGLVSGDRYRQPIERSRTEHRDL